MKNRITSLLLPLMLWAAFNSSASAVTITATMANGVTIMTTVEMVQRTVTYTWDFTKLVNDYAQVDISQLLFPATSLCNGCVVSAGLTEYSVMDAGGGTTDSVLQLKYEGGNPPSLINSVELTYGADYRFTGIFVDGSPGEPGGNGNIVLTFRYPPGGEYATLWAYTPEIISAPVPPAVWLFGSGLIGLIGIAGGKMRPGSIHNAANPRLPMTSRFSRGQNQQPIATQDHAP
jgi:hypothetical protein